MSAFSLWELADIIISNVATIVFNPLEYVSLFWPIVLIIALQYRRMLKMKAALFGVKAPSLWKPVAVALFYGIVGGIIGSFVMILIGITINGEAILYMWPIAIGLMLINPRYMCFSYAGGILSIAALLLGWEDFSIPQIMGLVAILHLVEAVLIYLAGHQWSVPIYIESNDRQVVGAYNLQSFWPIPLVLLTLVVLPEGQALTQGMSMPDWWPLIPPTAIPAGIPDERLLFLALPVVAGLGYGDLAMTQPPKAHAFRSAFNLGIYSVSLLALAVLASQMPSLALLPALFGPLAHEYLILWTQQKEKQGTPFFAPSPWGLKVMEVAKASPAARLGLQAGDILTKVNGLSVYNKRDLQYATQWDLGQLEVEYLAGPAQSWKRSVIQRGWQESFGIIAVPDETDLPQVKLQTQGLLGR